MSSETGPQPVHLHADDYPATIVLLDKLLGHRRDLTDCYQQSPRGCWVDWDGLERLGLSSTEHAYLRIARGCAELEWHGSGPPGALDQLRATFAAVTDDPGPAPLTGPAEPGPWGPYRERVTELVASCRDYLGRIERSLTGEITTDRAYVAGKARDLHHKVTNLVRLAQDVERWLAQCGAEVHHHDEDGPWVTECSRQAGHTGGCSDWADDADWERLDDARRAADNAEQFARLIGGLHPDDRAPYPAGTVEADEEAQALAEIADLAQRITNVTSRLTSGLEPRRTDRSSGQ